MPSLLGRRWGHKKKVVTFPSLFITYWIVMPVWWRHFSFFLLKLVASSVIQQTKRICQNEICIGMKDFLQNARDEVRFFSGTRFNAQLFIFKYMYQKKEKLQMLFKHSNQSCTASERFTKTLVLCIGWIKRAVLQISVEYASLRAPLITCK